MMLPTGCRAVAKKTSHAINDKAHYNPNGIEKRRGHKHIED